MDTKITKTEQYGLVDKEKQRIILEETPAQFIKTRPGKAGMTFRYVETGYMIDRLNKLFNYMWSFEVKEKSQNTSMTQVAVLGKLTGYIVIPTTPPFIQAIVKEQWGGADIKKWSSTAPSNLAGTPIDIADDYKSASSDALKKCASMLGIASDLYWKGYEAPETGDVIKIDAHKELE